MTDKSRAAAEALVEPYLPEASRREGLPLIFYMFTDMKTQSTDLMCYGRNAEEIIRDAFHVEPEGSMARLPGVVSRKKQLIPPRCWQHCRPGSDRLTAASRRLFFLWQQKERTKENCRCF